MLWSAALRRALPQCRGAPRSAWSAALRSAVLTAFFALAILPLGWFALRPTSQTMQAFDTQAFNARGLAIVQTASAIAQAPNAQGFAAPAAPQLTLPWRAELFRGALRRALPQCRGAPRPATELRRILPPCRPPQRLCRPSAHRPRPHQRIVDSRAACAGPGVRPLTRESDEQVCGSRSQAPHLQQRAQVPEPDLSRTVAGSVGGPRSQTSHARRQSVGVRVSESDPSSLVA